MPNITWPQVALAHLYDPQSATSMASRWTGDRGAMIVLVLALRVVGRYTPRLAHLLILLGMEAALMPFLHSHEDREGFSGVWVFWRERSWA